MKLGNERIPFSDTVWAYRVTAKIESDSLRHTCDSVGNPIHPANGLKTQVEPDFVGPGMLGYSRTYLSYPTTLSGSVNGNWLGSFDRRIVVFSTVGTGYSAIAQRESGQLMPYPLKADSLDRMIDRRTDQTRPPGWDFYDGRSSALEVYTSGGALSSIHRADGQKQSLTYSDASTAPEVAPWPGLLIRVMDSFGRQLSFAYDSAGRIKRLEDPNSRTYRYEYDSFGNLEFVRYPLDGGSAQTSRQYHYEYAALPNALTGITDEANWRFAQFVYDPSGFAKETRHWAETGVAADEYTLQYTSSTYVTDPRGSRLTYGLQAVAGTPRVKSRSQPAGSGCNASTSSVTYDDANANALSRVDFSNRKTCYAYDTVANAQKNLETVRVEGFEGAAACPADLASYVVPSTLAADKPQRKISTQWHPGWRLESRVAEPKLITTSVYNGQADPISGQVLTCAPADALLPDASPIAVLCRRTEQPTSDATGSLGFAAVSDGAARTRNYSYNRWGQRLTENRPRTDVADVSTWAYYADTSTVAGAEHTLGDLKSMTNPAGHRTDYLRYDKAGRLLKSRAANGVVTEITYTPRGWVDVVTVTPSVSGVPQLTDHDYWPTGLLKRVTQPDGSRTAYTYDGAHRLTDVTDTAGNTVHYTLDEMGNRKGEDLKDPGGALARSITRIFDDLNRPQNVTGAPQ
jgi:YD repeat-containing protein